MSGSPPDELGDDGVVHDFWSTDPAVIKALAVFGPGDGDVEIMKPQDPPPKEAA